jgi:hypothetical protein
VLHASPVEAADCAPHVTLMLREAPEPSRRYALGGSAQLFIAAQCGHDGEARSWRATGGEISLSTRPGGWALHIHGARMEPSPGENSGFGQFVVDGCSELPAGPS